MNAIDLLKYAVGNAFGILGQVTADLTQEQADWVPPGIANPIGATWWHTVSGTDLNVHKWCAGQAPIFESAGWRDKVLLASGPEPERTTREHMLSIQVNLPALHAYTEAVAEAVQALLSTQSPKDLERRIDKYNVGELLERRVIWHINAHCGEIAALKGCQGVKGYPF